MVTGNWKWRPKTGNSDRKLEMEMGNRKWKQKTETGNRKPKYEAGNGNRKWKQEMETGSGNWKQKLEMETGIRLHHPGHRAVRPIICHSLSPLHLEPAACPSNFSLYFSLTLALFLLCLIALFIFFFDF